MEKRTENRAGKLLVERHGHIVLLTLNRPGKRNALDAETICLLSDAYVALRADADVRAVIITGANNPGTDNQEAGQPAFSAGADLETVVPLIRGHRKPANIFEERLLREPALFRRCLLLDDDIGKPLIAAVNGVALAGGMELVQACDIRLATDRALFGLPEIRRGLFPSGGSTVRLPRQIGLPRALEMLLTGDPVDAQTAHSWGLVNHIVPHVQLLDHAFMLARRIAVHDPATVQAIRHVARQSGGRPEEEGLALETRLAAPILRDTGWYGQTG